MGLAEKLTELDEKILHGYEKVTNYCDKEYGWNKYDLARKANTLNYAASLSVGAGWTLEGVLGDDLTTTVFATLTSLVILGAYSVSKKILEEKEKTEIGLLAQSGAVNKPNFRPARPVISLGSLSFLGALTYSKFTGGSTVPRGNSLSPEAYGRLESFFWAMLTLSYAFAISRSYFEDQIMTPPKKKKSVWKAISEKFTEKVQVSVPQLEAKYQSIDDVAV